MMLSCFVCKHSAVPSLSIVHRITYGMDGKLKAESSCFFVNHSFQIDELTGGAGRQ